METIEKITFHVNNKKLTFKIYKFEEETIRKIQVPIKIDETTLSMGYKYEDTKVKITKYALYQESIINVNYNQVLICESESYTIILEIVKKYLTEYIETIDKNIKY